MNDYEPDWIGLIKALSILLIAIAALKIALFGGAFSWENIPGVGTIKFGSAGDSQVAGKKGYPREGSKNTVWQSECPPKSKPISGICIIHDTGNVPPLQNIGPNQSENRWECAWKGPVNDADVRAVCVTTE
jgi:hypothetical protein